MSIFFWFLIIAIATLAVNMIIILYMKKKRSVSVLPVFAVLIAGYLAAALLYLLTAMQGVQILEQKQAACLDIETESYRSARAGSHTAYAFCSKEGISFRFDDADLLTDDVPETPTVVEVYFCKMRTGFSACYLNEETAVCYILR